MEAILSETELRVAGALVEKALTTPDYYPMTLNALVAACNQKSNRHPVVSYDDKTVARALEGLREKGFANRITSQDARVPKYQHNLPEKLDLDLPQLAVLCVLMLRGPQTVGELRGRTGRMHSFQSLEEVEQVLAALISREDQPLVKQLPRQPGRKESRYAQLLAGEPRTDTQPEAQADMPLETATQEVLADAARIEQLESDVARLEEELGELKQEFLAFRKQFE
ncbi:MAG: YceH family protein [Candidatus Sumerlaeota bacterium]